MRIDRQQAFSGTRAADLDAETLAGYLQDRASGFRGPLRIERFNGGQSNPTYKLKSPTGIYVLRRKPPGKLLASAHSVEREYRVTAYLHEKGFPVARPFHLCSDESIIGSVFYVMEFIDGRVLWEPFAPDVSAEDRKAIFASLNATIAKLHLTDVSGLDGFGKPEGYVQRQINRWSEQYRLSETGEIAEMNRLMDWLPDACPTDSDAALVHGDFRLDNCIIHQTEPRIVALLDWELSTLGDPIADFTYHLMQWFMPPSETGGGVGSLAGHENDPGIPSLDDYVRDYCIATRRTGLPDLNIYLAYNFFRLAAILQGIAGRVRDGTAANVNAAIMGGQVRPLAQTAWAFARKAGA